MQKLLKSGWGGLRGRGVYKNAKVTKNCDGVGGGLKNAKVINWKMQKLQKIGWGGVFKNAEVIK